MAGDDVARAVGVECGHRNHAVIAGRDRARDDRLQAEQDFRPRDQRVDRALGKCGVAAGALHVDGENLLESGKWAGTGGEMPDGQPGQVVHAVDLVHGEALEQAVVDHRLRAETIFLVGLEDEMDGSVEVTVLGECFRGAQQHGRVTVVAAAVELAGGCGTVREVVGLLDWQGIHVGAQTDHAAALAPSQSCDQAMAGDAGCHFEPRRREPFGHRRSRVRQIESDLRRVVQVAAKRRECFQMRRGKLRAGICR